MPGGRPRKQFAESVYELYADTQTNLCALFGVSADVTRNWSRQPDFPKRINGKGWPVGAIARWAIAHLKSSLAPKDTQAWQLRKIAADAQTRELELRKAKGELCERDAIIRQLEGLATLVRNNLLSLPDQISAEVPPDCRERTKERVDAVVRRALRTIAGSGRRVAD